MNHDDPKLLDQRKLDHLLLCAEQDVEHRHRGTLLGDVRLIHDSLPELDVSAIDLSVELVGRRLAAPVMISGMTGGTARAKEVNRVLAQVAEEFGLAFGVGSQRAMMRDPAQVETYAVRDVAPTALILGNIGVVQAAASTTAEVRELVEAIGADALCVHLNPGQEIVQDHGDRDFRGCVDALGRLVAELGVPVIAKETGCGMSRRTLQQLHDVGVRTVDVSGAGGTTWVGVEALRSQTHNATIGDVLWDWGVPTAASVAWAHEAGMEVIASGGIRNGLDIGRSLALGATVGSCALPWLRAAFDGGIEPARALARTLIDTVRAVMLLTSSPDVASLRRCPRVIGPELQRWLEQR